MVEKKEDDLTNALINIISNRILNSREFMNKVDEAIENKIDRAVENAIEEWMSDHEIDADDVKGLEDFVQREVKDLLSNADVSIEV